MKQTKYFLFIVISLTILLQGCQEVIKEVPQENKENLEEPTSHKIQTLNNILELQNFTIVAPKIPKSNNVYRRAANELPNAVLSNLETSELFYVKFQQENQRTILVKDLGHLKNKTGNLFIYSSNSKELHKIIHIKNGIPVWGSTSPSKNSQLSNQRVIVETGCARYEKVYIWNVKIVEWYRENEDGTSTYLWTDEISRTITGSFLVCTEFYNNYSPSSQDSSPRIEEEVVDSRKVMQELKMRRCIESDGNSPLYCNCIINNDCEELVTLDDSFENNPKVKCVYDRLNAVCGNLFNQTIGQFQEDKDLHLHWKVGDCEYSAVGACTSSLINGTVTITIQNTTQSKIQLAKTILHEAIHANIEAFLYGDHDLSGYAQNYISKLEYLYNYFQVGQGDPSNAPDHYFMSEYYVTPIAQALWEFNDRQGDVGDYLHFAWEGLPAEYYLTEEERSELVDRITNINVNLISCD